MSDKKILTTPIKAEDLADINIGDIIYLNGYIVTCRDVAHRRLINEKRPLPVDIKDGAILHAGPIIRALSDDKYEMI
ncbi:MAG TPA: L(+)-tartrate dehydratase subunit beta, partial [Pasteurellaceae bacterium]|nr:L(+)-tartrate dehydratase subunit beta [Pasteurellaceae bacterium]